MRAVLICVLLAASGCGASGSVGAPRAALDRFAAAAQREDGVTALYEMLPARARRAETLEAFRARVRADRAELAALGLDVAQALAQGGIAQVELPLHGRASVMLVDESDGWRVGEAGVGLPGGASLAGLPGARAALRALHAVLVRNGLGAWTRSLSARARGDLRAELDALVEATENPEALTHRNTGRRVEFDLPDGRVLEVVFENASWRVDRLRERE